MEIAAAGALSGTDRQEASPHPLPRTSSKVVGELENPLGHRGTSCSLLDDVQSECVEAAEVSFNEVTRTVSVPL